MKASLIPPKCHAYSRPIFYIMFKSRYNTVYGFMTIVVLLPFQEIFHGIRGILYTSYVEILYIRCTFTVGVQVNTVFFFLPENIGQQQQSKLTAFVRNKNTPSYLCVALHARRAIIVHAHAQKRGRTYKVVFFGSSVKSTHIATNTN